MGSFSVWHWIIVFLIIGLFALPMFFYIRTYQGVTRALNSKGANAPTTSVWLLFVPLFSIAWFFVLLIKLKDAIAETKIEGTSKTWWTYGIISGVLFIASFLGGMIGDLLSGVIFIAWFVFAILHWVELASLRKRLGS